MLQKRPQDLECVREMVLKARWNAIKQLEKSMKDKIKDFDFKPGSLVLVRNSKADKMMSDRTKPRYLGPIVVIRRTKGGSYILGELDKSLSKLQYAAFRLIPYLPRVARDIQSIPITKLLDLPQEELEKITHDSGNHLDVEAESD